MPSGPTTQAARRGREWIRRHRTLDASWRVFVFLVGGAVLLAGLVMFFTPGPGWLGAIAGLAILATEFAWAQRLLAWARRKAGDARRQASDPRRRRQNLFVTFAVVAVALLATWWYVEANGWPRFALDVVDAVMSWF
jgi:uncharacterized protein (TIGR02611 family)